MFTGDMVTEAIPTRVFSLYKIVTSKKGILREEVRKMMEPPDICTGTSYFSHILMAAAELKLISLQDNIVVPLRAREEMKNIEDFRRDTISKLDSFVDGQFYKVTNIIVNMNEQVYKYALTDDAMLNFISQRVGSQITPPMVRGWRFWAQFLGFGYINKMSFFPNAYIFVKDVLKLIKLEKDKEYQIDDFMNSFEPYGKILLGNLQSERNMNIALSGALRELHDNKEIELKYRSDAKKRWILYPSSEQFNDQVASIVYKGEKK